MTVFQYALEQTFLCMQAMYVTATTTGGSESFSTCLHLLQAVIADKD